MRSTKTLGLGSPTVMRNAVGDGGREERRAEVEVGQRGLPGAGAESPRGGDGALRVDAPVEPEGRCGAAGVPPEPPPEQAVRAAVMTKRGSDRMADLAL